MLISHLFAHTINVFGGGYAIRNIKKSIVDSSKTISAKLLDAFRRQNGRFLDETGGVVLEGGFVLSVLSNAISGDSRKLNPYQIDTLKPQKNRIITYFKFDVPQLLLHPIFTIIRPASLHLTKSTSGSFFSTPYLLSSAPHHLILPNPPAAAFSPPRT
jgi:hypothetical protein